MRLRLIVNPRATHCEAAVVAEVVSRLRRVAEVEVVRTERAGHARELAAGPADAVVALGGDGTANEVINGVAPGVVVGLIPAGASSILARSLGYPVDQRQAARALAAAIAAGSIRTIGLGDVDGRRFTFAAGFGYDAEVVREVDRMRDADPLGRRPSDLRFIQAMATVLRRSGWRLDDRMTVTPGGRRPWRASYLAIANQHPYTYLGRIPVKATPAARFELGLDAVAMGPLRSRDLWRFVAHGLVWPWHVRNRDPRVAYVHDADLIEVACDEPVALQVDGEYLGEVASATVSAVPAALRVFSPVARRAPAPGSARPAP